MSLLTQTEQRTAWDRLHYGQTCCDKQLGHLMHSAPGNIQTLKQLGHVAMALRISVAVKLVQRGLITTHTSYRRILQQTMEINHEDRN